MNNFRDDFEEEKQENSDSLWWGMIAGVAVLLLSVIIYSFYLL